MAYTSSHSQALREIKKMSCQALEKSYDATDATIQQKQQYSDCIQLLYPDAITPFGILLVKIWILCILVGFGIGIWKAYKNRNDRYSDSIDYFIFGMTGLGLGALLPILVLCIIIGIEFLFS